MFRQMQNKRRRRMLRSNCCLAIQGFRYSHGEQSGGLGGSGPQEESRESWPTLAQDQVDGSAEPVF